VFSFPIVICQNQRHDGVKDPCGNIWWVATHVEDLSPEEQERRETLEGIQTINTPNCGLVAR
jgi:hypothetical protein